MTADVLRGLVAAMAMTGMRSLTTQLGLVRMTPPDELGRRGAGAHLLQRVRPEHRGAAIELAHWTYGGVGAAAFGLLPPATRSSRLAGAAYGLTLWALYEGVVAPLFGADRKRTPAERAAVAADHVLYGLVVTGR